MKRLLIGICFILPSIFLFALPQNKISIQLHQEKAALLFDLISKTTGYRIFTEKPAIDSTIISIDVKEISAYEALDLVFGKSEFSVVEYNKDFFIFTKGVISAYLPDFSQIDENLTDDADEYGFQDESSSVVNATSEYKLYEIGKPSEGVGKYKLTGKITQLKTGEPIPGVTVYVPLAQTGTATDKNGRYELVLAAGKYEMEIRGVGLRNTKRQFRLNASGEMNIEADEEQITLSEVTITSSARSNVRETTMGVERFKIKEIKNIPMAFGEMDILKVVMALPGVKSAGEVSNGFNVRGGSTDQNLILLNDGTIYNPTHLFGLFSAFNPDVVQDIELYMSNIPAQYGGRISSVLDVKSREGDRNKIHGSASLGLLTSRLSVEGPVGKKTTFLVGARSTYSDWLLRLIPEKSGFNDGKAGFYDMNGTVIHRFSENNKLSVNGYMSKDHYSFDPTEKFTYQNMNFSARWDHNSGKQLSYYLSAGYDDYRSNIRNTDNAASAYNLGSGVSQFFLKNDYRYIINDKQILNFGINTVIYNLNPGAYSPEGSGSIAQHKNLQRDLGVESALHISDQWEVTDKLSVNGGIRYSLFGLLGPRTYYRYDEQYLPSETTVTDTINGGSGVLKTYKGAEFRLSLRYAFKKDWSFKAGFNTMRQYIHKISNSTVMAPTDTWKLSDVNIKPQTGMQVAAGIYKNFVSNTVESSVEVYYKTMNNFLDYRNGAVLVMNGHIETDVLGTQGKAYGAEFILKKPAGRLNGWISYTYSRTFLRQSDSRTLSPVNDGDWYPADFDKPHDFKLVGNFKITHRYSLSYNCFYSTGRPITIPVSKYGYMNGEYVYYSDRNKYRIPDFFRIDASFNIEPSHHLTLLTHSTISLGVYNLTGKDNVYSVYFKSVNGVLKGYKLSIFGVPIPYISYNIKF
ncbi:MAG: putative outer membrane protein involved in nutrient binding [Bacteroidetes bacterium]|nr:putative outer membrane protein involved in nutrient binding [Bacteroidota bacterium]